MFTGLIQDVGILLSARPSQGGSTLEIQTSLDTADWELGESVAVDGVCLTVTRISGRRFTVDCSPETLRRTTLGQRTPQSSLHLERALRLGDRLGGHLVSGHVDGVATVTSITPEGNALLLTFQPPEELLRYMIEKGSIAIDGVSLTINTLQEGRFSVAIIPHTQAKTHLGQYQPGTRVHLEVDQVGKYIERLVLPWKDAAKATSGTGITEEFLKMHGFS